MFEKLPNLPVYRVKPEKGRVIVKTLHHDHLLPIRHLVRFPVDPERKPEFQRPATRSTPESKTNSQDESTKPTSDDNGNDMSEREEDELWYLSTVQRESVSQALDLLANHFNQNVPDLDTEPNLPPVNACPEEPQRASNDLEVEEEPEIMQLPDDTVADTGLEGGALPSTSQSESIAEPFGDHQSRREVKPVIRLSYDKPGHSVDKPIVVVHRGLRITICRESNPPMVLSVPPLA